MGRGTGFLPPRLPGFPQRTSPDRRLLPRLGVDVDATNPVLVVGILHDPNTPYPWSQAMVSRIRNSHLLSVDMYGHVATGKNSCATAKIGDYLVNGTLPSDGEVCAADPEPQAGGGEKG